LGLKVEETTKNRGLGIKINAMTPAAIPKSPVASSQDAGCDFVSLIQAPSATDAGALGSQRRRMEHQQTNRTGVCKRDRFVFFKYSAPIQLSPKEKAEWELQIVNLLDASLIVRPFFESGGSSLEISKRQRICFKVVRYETMAPPVVRRCGRSKQSG